MKPPPFDYHRATSLDDALSVLGEAGDDALVLAGGQSLIPLLNLRLARPSVLVDVNRIPDLDGVSSPAGGGLAVGALARARAVERSAEVRAALPVLSEAIGHIAHPQVRVRTTMGGNLAHADPSSELPAVLVALEGAVELASSRGRRTVPASEFFLDAFTTAKRADELVVGVYFPSPAGFRWRFLEVARRHGDYGLVAACVGLRVDDGRVAEARIALASCGTVPVRPAAAESALVGATPATAAVTAADAVRAAVEPGDDIHATGEYRRHLAGTLVGRAVASILEER